MFAVAGDRGPSATSFGIISWIMAKSSDPYIVSGGDISFSYFDMDSYDNAFMIYGPGLNFKNVYEHLKKVVCTDDIRDVCEVDSDIFNVTVTPQAKAGDAYVVANGDIPFRYFDVRVKITLSRHKCRDCA